MRSTERHYDALRGDHYHILKVHVILPLSPLDYLKEAFISNFATDTPQRRRLKRGPPQSKDDVTNYIKSFDTTCPEVGKCTKKPGSKTETCPKHADSTKADTGSSLSLSLYSDEAY